MDRIEYARFKRGERGRLVAHPYNENQEFGWIVINETAIPDGLRDGLIVYCPDGEYCRFIPSAEAAKAFEGKHL